MDGVDDMGWLFQHPLLEWERLDLHASDWAVVDCVDYWLWKEALHVEALHVQLSDAYLRPNDETQLFFLHLAAQEIRAQSDRARELGLYFTLPP
jgi:hypothetical protein